MYSDKQRHKIAGGCDSFSLFFCLLKYFAENVAKYLHKSIFVRNFVKVLKTKTMTLTETQTKQAQDLIEQYGFCTLETQEELAKAGFFEKVKVNFDLLLPKNELHDVDICIGQDYPLFYEKSHICVPMPQMGEVWKQLPNEIIRNGGKMCKCLGAYTVYYESIAENEPDEDGSSSFIGESIGNDNETEAMCQLWLKLHKENLL